MNSALIASDIAEYPWLSSRGHDISLQIEPRPAAGIAIAVSAISIDFGVAPSREQPLQTRAGLRRGRSNSDGSSDRGARSSPHRMPRSIRYGAGLYGSSVRQNRGCRSDTCDRVVPIDRLDAGNGACGTCRLALRLPPAGRHAASLGNRLLPSSVSPSDRPRRVRLAFRVLYPAIDWRIGWTSSIDCTQLAERRSELAELLLADRLQSSSVWRNHRVVDDAGRKTPSMFRRTPCPTRQGSVCLRRPPPGKRLVSS